MLSSSFHSSDRIRSKIALFNRATLLPKESKLTLSSFSGSYIDYTSLGTESCNFFSLFHGFGALKPVPPRSTLVSPSQSLCTRSERTSKITIGREKAFPYTGFRYNQKETLATEFPLGVNLFFVRFLMLTVEGSPLTFVARTLRRVIYIGLLGDGEWSSLPCEIP